MEWYEIVGIVVIWLLGLYLRGKFFEQKKNMYHNDSWNKKK